MTPIRKIIATADVLRVSQAGQGSQNVNIRWLRNLLAPALRMLTDTPLEMLLHDRADGNLAHDFHRLNELQMCGRNRVEHYARPPSPQDLEKIGAAFQGSLGADEAVEAALPKRFRSRPELLSIAGAARHIGCLQHHVQHVHRSALLRKKRGERTSRRTRTRSRKTVSPRSNTCRCDLPSHPPQFCEPVLAAAGMAVRPAPAVDKTLSLNGMHRSLWGSWGADIFMTAP